LDDNLRQNLNQSDAVHTTSVSLTSIGGEATNALLPVFVAAVVGLFLFLVGYRRRLA
jgi:hypothetical protein